jgi:hypothetical protein
MQTRKVCSIVAGKVLFCFCLCLVSLAVLLLTFLLFFYPFNRNIICGRNYALQEIDQLQPALFKRMFHIDSETFSDIQEAIPLYMTAKNLQKACNRSGGPVQLKTHLAVTLRRLAGASFLDLCFAFGISSSTFCHADGVLWPTVQAIDEAYTIGFPFGDIGRMESLSEGFYNHSGGVLDGCVLALDGLGVATRQPFKWEVKNPKDYRFQKGGLPLSCWLAVILKHGLLPLTVPIVDPLMTSLRGKIQRFMKCWRLTRCFLINIFL